MISLGQLYRDVYSDHERARECFTKAIKMNDAGQARAENELAYMYMYEAGLGVQKSEPQAFKLYEKAAKSGYAPAQYNLGRMWESSKKSEAVSWYRLAAKQGHSKAIERLASLEND